MTISVPVSVGEVIDKLTILQIKNEKIADHSKLANIQHELNALNTAISSLAFDGPVLAALQLELRGVNEELWRIEDAIRECEHRRDFGTEFIELARSVYKMNDRRAEVKRRINELTGSSLIEEKSYKEYS